MSENKSLVMLELAERICNCLEVAKAFRDSNHACHRVVNVQKVGPNDSLRQRPEPWFGNLQDAQVLFISSNPSINEATGEKAELFPTYSWDVAKSADFFVNRVTDDEDSPVSFNHPTFPKNFVTRCVDGQYRNDGKDNSSPQQTWNAIHGRAMEILAGSADPRVNYAITEVVHCKSEKVEGVDEASTLCASLWMTPIFNLSPARVVVLVGSKVTKNYAIPNFGLSEEFGSTKDFNNLETSSRIKRDTFIDNSDGVNRVFIHNHHNGAKEYQKLPVVYGDHAVEMLGKIAREEIAVPTSTDELHKLLLGSS